MRQTAEIWRGRVVAWRSSGESLVKFCSDKDFSHQALQRWGARLRDTAGEVGATSIGLARVTTRGNGGTVRLEVEGARIVVDAATDLSLLAHVLRALRVSA